MTLALLEGGASWCREEARRAAERTIAALAARTADLVVADAEWTGDWATARKRAEGMLEGAPVLPCPSDLAASRLRRIGVLEVGAA